LEELSELYLLTALGTVEDGVGLLIEEPEGALFLTAIKTHGEVMIAE
jgi:hypothetical protein